MARTRNFADLIRAKMAAKPELATAVEEESFNADIAQKVYDLRTEAGMTQKELADLVGTQQSVISRVEDADYDGHSLATLRRVASALNRRLRVEFYCQPIVQDDSSVEFQIDWPSSIEWQAKISNVGDENKTVLSPSIVQKRHAIL